MTGRWLAPLGAAYGVVAAARVAAYRHGVCRRARLTGPVISVGNLSVGGTGKTPLVAWIAGALHAAGERVAILSRGYAGRFRGESLVVSDGDSITATAAEAGDEPLMLARRLPGVVVAVGARRDVVGREVEARFGHRVHVLDDGFQHLRLHRDLDLLCVDATAEDAWPLPAGPLREFASAARRADLVLLTQSDRAPAGRVEALVQRHGADRTLRIGHRLAGFTDVEGNPAEAPARAYAVSGVAGPERFEADLASLSILAGRRRFPDHHAFSPAEVALWEAEALRLGAAAIVITEKDAARVRELGRDPATAAPLPTLVLRLEASVPDDGRLMGRLLAAARRAPGSVP
jgi:tetraacyldisaccharide 4'-kinase